MRLRLKELRNESGITQKDLASMLSVDLKTVGNWEGGKTALKLDDACRICDALGCTPNDLCGWYDDHPRESAQEPLPPEEAELMRNYRSCTPQWRANISMTARAAAGEAREEAERDVSGSERVTKAV